MTIFIPDCNTRILVLVEVFCSVVASMKAEREYCLYSVGDGVVLQHDMNNVSRPAVNIDSIISATNREILQVAALFPN